jgi:hypothetical protein
VSEHEQGMTTADIAGSGDREQEARERDTRDEDRPLGRDDRAGDGRTATADAELAPLFDEDERDDLQGRWSELQTRFVDDPRTTVEEADGLVAHLMQRLAESFAEERSSLEQQWSRGDDADTEDLRVALQRYRSFFERLLSA